MWIFKIVSTSILVSGLLLAVFGIIILRSVNRDMRLVEAMQNEGIAQGIDTQQFRTIVIRNGIGYVVIGLVAATSGIGLLFRRKWARRLWLALAVVLISLLTYQICRAIWFAGVDWGGLLAQISIIGPIVLITWYICGRRTAAFMLDGTAD